MNASVEVGYLPVKNENAPIITSRDLIENILYNKYVYIYIF